MIFYLQCGISDNRLGYREHRTFLDDHRHSKCEIVHTYEVPPVVDGDTERRPWCEARAMVPM